jgi:hypothetical protein
MLDTIADRVRRWSREYYEPIESNIDLENATVEEIDTILELSEKHTPSKYGKILSQLSYLAIKLYSEYEITKYSPYSEFPYRLRDWLDSTLNEEEQKILFQLVPKIFFIGSNEYLSLYQTAFNGPIARWLIDQLKIDITDKNAQKNLNDALNSTWFCAITDSMQISRFYHVNQINGANLRPDWRVLYRLGCRDKIATFMAKHNPPLERIVLLEDFVGTGGQMSKAVEYALGLSNNVPVLLCPMVIAPSGYNIATYLVKQNDRLSFDPTLVLDSSTILYKKLQDGEDIFYQELRNVITDLHFKVLGSQPNLDAENPYGFGHEPEQGGLLVVMYTNCPDNTLPIIYNTSDGPWKPLFPRSSRI